MNRISLVLFVALGLAWPLLLAAGRQDETQQASKPGLFFVVRHAEKAAEGGRDPQLSAKGLARAAALARALSTVGLESVSATEYHRTQDTAAPTAKRAGLEVQSYGAAKTRTHAVALASAGGTHLVIGHSNTVPVILKSLGVTEEIALQEDEYDDLFCVVRDGAGQARLIRLHYGDDDQAEGQ
ncbi:MAG: histidine phosphatase family protein [Planctomycetes bacterium]|nr:histidine phosphatase family protein [Planctomycetota bacterium]